MQYITSFLRHACIVGCTIAAAAVPAAPQSSEIVGSWKLMALAENHGGKVEQPLGLQFNGFAMFSKDGNFSVFVSAGDRAKSDQHPLVPVGPVIAYYGVYTLADSTLTYRVKGATYPNFEGTDQKATIKIEGDTLQVVRTVTGGAQPFTVTLQWQRVP